MTIHARVALPDPEELSDSGREVLQSILSTRGNLDGPFLAWLHSPEFASRAERLGAFCRYETQLSALESELLILIVAAHYRCTAEWQIHFPIAQRTGLDAKTTEAIRIGATPVLLGARHAHLHAFASELLSQNRVSDRTFEDARCDFSVKELVEVVGILGYYSLVALTLNSFEVRLEDRGKPFD